MSEDGGGTDRKTGEKPGTGSAAEASHDERLKRLEQQIAEAKKSVAPAPRTDDHISQANVGWRMVTELVAGLVIGFGIGYGLDAVFGTRPWLMILFIGFGLAAGVKTMLRTAKAMQDEIAAAEAAGKKGD